MRIATLDRIPAADGGSERMLLSIARGLFSRGHEISLMFEREAGLVPAYRAFCGNCVQVKYPLFGIRRLPLAAFEAFIFGRRLRRLGVDLLLAADVSQFGCAGAIAAASALPLSLHLGVNVEGPVRRMVWVGRVARVGVAPSSHTAETWAAAGWPRSRLRVVPNWVDQTELDRPSFVHAEARAKLSLRADEPVILYLGRIVPEKGIDTLLRAWAELGRLGSSAALVLVGTAPDWFKETIKTTLRALGVTVNRFLMPGPSDCPSVWFRAADLLVLPSEWEEPFGLTPLEAIVAGTLPLVSSAGFLPEIVGPENRDLVFPKGNPEALARLLERWLPDSSEKRQRIEALRVRVAREFCPERGVAAYEEILLGASGRGRERGALRRTTDGHR